MHDDDRSLREQLRGADPARDLAPLPPTWLDHRMEQIMTDTTTPAVPARSARRTWIPIAGVAAALAIGAAIAVPLAIGGTPTVEPLALPEGGGLASGSCLTVDAAGLLAQEQAFAARVLTVEGDIVTFEVTERFAGDVADRITVPQVDELTTSTDFSLEPFAAGDSYLVTATDGTISACGLSGPDTPELRALFVEAFGG
ncbi:hypothetical protein [Microcella sp.]|uniref:hypothetical protein n=1 Tax=Microcella sp. TaxID=1913979 RepID=UPI00391B1896